MTRLLRLAGQPLLLLISIGLWMLFGGDSAAAPITVITMLAVLFILERWQARRRDWRQSIGEKVTLAGAWIVLGAILGLITIGYEQILYGLPLPEQSAAIWPHSLPWPVQAMLLFLVSDLVYYWIHRAIHTWPWLWRASGHGVHHAFHNLHAVNAGVTHPFELLLLALPIALIGTVFSIDPAVVAAGVVLLGTNSQLVHANLDLGAPGIRWIVTTGADHRVHHSMVREQSDRNYACNAIIWDRLFGTHAIGEVSQTGTGSHQPDPLHLALLPFRKAGRRGTSG
ncbi:MAG TPA: sterol desaturase family protein [Wenzhouxiangellaceae bacterium]|nr:sterol desaturase family protein [Wenzhouxiangellaceae bacterium]